MKTIDLRFEQVELSEADLVGFYTTGPGKNQGSILVPTIFTSPNNAYVYVVFGGGITAYVEKSRLRAVLPEPAKPVVEQHSGISENALLRALAIAQDPTLALQLIKD